MLSKVNQSSFNIVWLISLEMQIGLLDISRFGVFFMFFAVCAQDIDFRPHMSLLSLIYTPRPFRQAPLQLCSPKIIFFI